MNQVKKNNNEIKEASHVQKIGAIEHINRDKKNVFFFFDKHKKYVMLPLVWPSKYV